MERTFNADEFIARIGKRLVEEFNAARAATSPSAVGDAMEQPVRIQLEQILPRGIGVGSGFIIDSDGGTSRQTDVVLYEKDICPVFSINNTPETTYYPCEGVIAVGEIKSILDRESLKDAFKKVASVKRLQRHVVHHPVPVPTTGELIVMDRQYGNLHNPSPLDMARTKEQSQAVHILGFVLAGHLRLQSDTFCDAFRQFTHQTSDMLSPNLVAILDGKLVTWGNIAKERQKEVKWSDRHKGYVLEERQGNQLTWETSWSAQKASCFQYTEETDTFRTLIRWIYEIYRTGKTSDVRAFDRYFLRKGSPNPSIQKFIPKNNVSLEALIQGLGITL